jgi:hypothetical protein
MGNNGQALLFYQEEAVNVAGVASPAQRGRGGEPGGGGGGEVEEGGMRTERIRGGREGEGYYIHSSHLGGGIDPQVFLGQPT